MAKLIAMADACGGGLVFDCSLVGFVIIGKADVKLEKMVSAGGRFPMMT